MSQSIHGGVASKILLMQAERKSKIRSWLSSSSDENGREAKQTGSDADAIDKISTFRADDENAGLGSRVKTTGEDDGSNRQLSSANDALCKKLLGRHAYKRYQDDERSGVKSMKPVRQVQADDPSDDEVAEIKGHSKFNVQQPPSVAKDNLSTRSVVEGSMSTSVSQPLSKKRPGRYLDQLLADRGRKKKQKAATKAEGE